MRGLALTMTIALCIICFISGYDYASKHCTNVVTRADTIIKRDTVTAVPDTVYKTIELGERIVKVAVRGDTLYRIDTVTVSLPFVQKQYKDSSYSAWVSGYEPSLDSIRIFPKTTIIRESKVVQKDRRWGVYGGVGIGVSDRVTPYVGVGIGYRIL